MNKPITRHPTSHRSRDTDTTCAKNATEDHVNSNPQPIADYLQAEYVDDAAEPTLDELTLEETLSEAQLSAVIHPKRLQQLLADCDDWLSLGDELANWDE